MVKLFENPLAVDKSKKTEFLKDEIVHIDIKNFNSIGLVNDFSKMAFQARNLARASEIYDKMLGDKDCSIILCLSGSLFSAGLKKIVYDMIENKMVDVIVSTGAIIVDQDFFEALGYKHYIGHPQENDNRLREARVDRIYDTYIDEDELAICDDTIASILDKLPPRPYSSREIIFHLGKYLDETGLKVNDSVILSAYRNNVPIFVPAFSDCSAGFAFLWHQWTKPTTHASIDSAKDFLELTKIKMKVPETALLMVGGGVPKNFAQDIAVAQEMVTDREGKQHKYAVQLTVADERDGALSGSTLQEASSWGKVNIAAEQMVFGEATLTFPLLASYAYHKGSWKNREKRNFGKFLNETDGQR